MKNFEPGGLRNRKPDLGGRPMSDAGKYAPKKRFETGGRPSFGSRPAFGGDRDKKEVTLYNATCTTCGKSCEVPFRPDGKKPVLCRDCFAAKNESPTNSANHHDRFTQNEMVGRKPERPAYSAPLPQSADYSKLAKQLGVVEDKLNQILTLIQASEKLVEALPIIGTKTIEDGEVSTTKIRKARKVTPAIKKAAVKKKVSKKATVTKRAAKKTA